MDPITIFCQQNGIPQSVAQAWRNRGITGWTPLQEAAWRAGIHRGPDHALLAGPTSAGKGLAGEIAVVRTLFAGRKALWLTPTRALAAQAARQFRQTLAGLGLRVLCATHDTADEDGRLYRNEFDLLVAVYEKATAWLTRDPHALAEVGLAVADELTMLRDPERGGRLDVLLTLLAASPYAPRRLGLTLPVANLDELAAWWGGRLLTCRERPRPLQEGVLDVSTGRLRWRNRADDAEGETELETPRGLERWMTRARRTLDDPAWPPLRLATAAVAGGLAARGEPTLLFASSRALVRRWAGGLAEAFAPRLPSRICLERAARLARREPTFDHQLLLHALKRGVGVHHADLCVEGRKLVEEAFAAGELGLLVATPTLAQGMNLAALNAIHWTECPEGSAPAGKWRKGTLERWRFADQGGRAGRYGLGEAPGRSILVAWDERQTQSLWRRYILEPAEPVASGLAVRPLGPALLTCLAGDAARTRENVRAFFGGTFAGATAWCLKPQALDEKLAAAAGEARAAELIAEDPDSGALRLTGLGQTCVAQGLEPATAARILPWLAAAEEKEAIDANAAEPLAALCALTLSAPAGLWPLQARPGQSPIAGELRAWFEEQGLDLPAPLTRVLEQPGGPAAEELAALEAAWRLSCWIGPEPVDQVERRTGWTAGALERIGEGLAWVAAGAGALTLARGGRLEQADAWRALATRLAAGATLETLDLAELRLAGLGRSARQALAAEGLTTAESLAEAPLEILAGILGDEDAARKIRDAAHQHATRAERALAGLGGGMPRMRDEREFRIADCGLRIEEEKTQDEESGHEHEESRSGLPGPQSTQPPASNSHLTLDIGHLTTHNEQQTTNSSPLLEIDLQSPGVVRVEGREVRLTPLTFDLLTALAERPGRVLTRAAIYQRLWPEDGPEEQQLDAHRRRLISELKGALGERAGKVVEVVRGMGFRLNLPERGVQLTRG